MTRERPSMQDLIGRRRRAGFVGRGGERAAFRANLDLPPEDERHRFLFHVHGNSGVGKTFLLRELEQVARERGAPTVYVDESVGSVPEAMAALCRQLAQQGHRLRKLEEALVAHRERRHEAEAEAAALEPAPGGPSLLTTTALRLGMAGVGALVPGAGAFVGAVDAGQLADGAARLKARLSARFRNQEDVQLVLSPERVLTPKLLDELADVTSCVPWLVLFFDTYERTGPFLDGWLHELMTTDRYGALPANVLVVTAGQRPFDTARWGGFADFMTDLPLGPFTEAEARGLLADRGVVAEPVVAEVLRLTRGLPVLVSTLAEARPADPDDVGDPSATAVERFLKWEPDPARRQVALACALPRRLDADVFRAATECAEDEADALYDWLRGMPFVSERGEQVQYHDVVRAPMLRMQRRRSPRGWAQRQERLAETFGRWRHERQDGLVDPWADEEWRELRLAEAYHRLCAGEQSALAFVLGGVARACGWREEEGRRWARMLVEAGADTRAEDVTRWGEDLLHALESRTAEQALTLLLDHAPLDTASRAIAHANRGSLLRLAEAPERALTEYERALALTPELMLARHGRALTRAALRDYPGAIADLDQVIAHDPDNAGHLTARGDYQRVCGHYDAALRDLDRAVALDPTLSGAWAARGATHHALRRYEQALADLDRALEIDPDFVWSLVRRARLHRALRDREHQLADLDRAVALDPEAPWVLCERGDALAAVGREAEALADYDKALALDPQYASAYASRGALHGRYGRDEEALADLDRALSLAPEYSWALVHRSKVRSRQGRYDRALVHAHRAVELDPQGAWALANKIHTDMSVGRLERARSDLERYVTLAGADADWAHRELATVHLLSGRYEEAVAALDTAEVRCAAALRARNWPLARQTASPGVRRALAVSGAESVSAARPLWASLAHANGQAWVRPVTSAALQNWPELDRDLHRFLTAPHPWPDLADLADALDILRLSPATDRTRLAPRLTRAIAARDAMRARYAE
ncbi:tetratricopeptide repeat protein [Streptomyces sp. FXJ1.172]|uniref:tetratricopeptide repeat protein n=1 Tax=Streptomyces sp. FXJ1.172 TaxID=710705 RepID=UPI00082B6729|nr:tetratricopeptide repeat protein [Streptomyces sp. FXJ1.172]WEO96851.1 tetratricopeptide repeat protein [Streptomyces sp. FXJ1.172]